MNHIETNTEYFNNAVNPNPDASASVWYPWDSGEWLRKGGMTKGGDPGRQRLTRYANDQPVKLEGVSNTEKDDRSLSWYHRRNFTLFLVNNRLNGPFSFPGNAFTAGRINGDGAAVTTVNNAAWIMCAVSLRGQARFRFLRDYNGWCWDGVSRSQAWRFANPSGQAGTATWRNVFYTCRIDFVGSTYSRSPNSNKRSAPRPIGYFGGQPVYGTT